MKRVGGPTACLEGDVMSIVLPEDAKERRRAIVKLVKGETAQYTIGRTSYTVKPSKPAMAIKVRKRKTG
jgi:ribosome recycling factor